MCLHSSDNIIERLSLDCSVIVWINSLVKRIHWSVLPFLGRSIHKMLFLGSHHTVLVFLNKLPLFVLFSARTKFCGNCKITFDFTANLFMFYKQTIYFIQINYEILEISRLTVSHFHPTFLNTLAWLKYKTVISSLFLCYV